MSSYLPTNEQDGRHLIIRIQSRSYNSVLDGQVVLQKRGIRARLQHMPLMTGNCRQFSFRCINASLPLGHAYWCGFWRISVSTTCQSTGVRQFIRRLESHIIWVDSCDYRDQLVKYNIAVGLKGCWGIFNEQLLGFERLARCAVPFFPAGGK